MLKPEGSRFKSSPPPHKPHHPAFSFQSLGLPKYPNNLLFGESASFHSYAPMSGTLTFQWHTFRGEGQIGLRDFAIRKKVSHVPQSLSVHCKTWRFQFSCETPPSIILLSKQNNLYGNIYEIVCHIGSLLKRLKDNILWYVLFFCKHFSMTEIKVFNGFCEGNIR